MSLREGQAGEVAARISQAGKTNRLPRGQEPVRGWWWLGVLLSAEALGEKPGVKGHQAGTRSGTESSGRNLEATQQGEGDLRHQKQIMSLSEPPRICQD